MTQSPATRGWGCKKLTSVFSFGEVVRMRPTGLPHGKARMSTRRQAYAAICASFLLFAKPATAAGIFVEGSSDCGNWLDARKTERSAVLEGYTLGYLNGLAIGHVIEFWHADGRGVSREAVYAWIDSYCQKAPLDLLNQAIMQLYRERSGWKSP